MKRFFGKFSFFIFGFICGVLFYGWATISGTGEVYAEANGNTLIEGKILENIGLKDRYLVAFQPDGTKEVLWVIPNQHYTTGDRAQMVLLPSVIAELRHFNLRYYEQVEMPPDRAGL